MLALLPGAAAAQVAAPPAAIQVLDSGLQSDFPRDLTFSLTAHGDADVVKATLALKQVGQPTITTSQVKFTPGREVSLRYVWDLQKYYVPPGVEVEYYWLLEDAAGQKVRTPAATFPVEDKRYAWRSRSDGSLQINWYEGDDAFAAELLQAGRRALDQLASDAGLQTDLPVKVFVYASQKDLLGALGPSAQEWTGGQTFAEQGVVFAAVEPGSQGVDFGMRVLPHELSHVVVHKMTDNPYGELPRWLDEGLAMYAEGSLEPSYERALAGAIKSNTLVSVQSLSANFPSDPQVALLSYAESYSLVKYIATHYGRERLGKLLAVFKEGSTDNGALQAALGVDNDGLEAGWRASIGAPPAPPTAPVLAAGTRESAAPWPLPAAGAEIAAAAILVAAGALVFAARRRRRST